MAIRAIRTDEDDILRKTSRPVKEIDDKIIALLDDMVDTMLEKNGVGLAAVQVGILKRIAVIDAPDNEEFDDDYESDIIEMINPEIIEQNGEVIKLEGCLSVFNTAGTVSRPEHVKVKFLNRSGKSVTLEAKGYRARAISHEIDHLDGILFIDRVIEFVDPEEQE